jgi:hypothetical protein
MAHMHTKQNLIPIDQVGQEFLCDPCLSAGGDAFPTSGSKKAAFLYLHYTSELVS